MYSRLLVVLSYGFSSGLPLALLSSTLQAWFANKGQSIYVTSLLSLLGLPYLLRVIWAPLLDQFFLPKFGKRRSWIVVTQLILVLGFNLMAWGSPEISPVYLASLAFLLTAVSATQDMAIEAQRIEYLTNNEFGMGAAIATFGYRLGMIVSGGVALMMAQRMGWTLTYQCMGGLMCIGLLTTFWIKEAPSENTPRPTVMTLYWHPLKQLLCRPGIGVLLGFIFFYKLAEVFTTITSGIVMPFLIQGLHFSLAAVGVVYKIIGVAALIVGGFVSGVLMRYLSMTRALLYFGLIQAITNLLFLILALIGKNLYLLIFAVICDNFAAGMGSTALVVLFMQCVDRRFTATQFSLLVMFATVPRIFSGPVAAMLQQSYGWVGLYQCAFVLSFAFIPFLLRVRQEINVTV